MGEHNQTDFYVASAPKPAGAPAEAPAPAAACLTVFAGALAPVEYALADFGKDVVTFGRGGQNDIVVESNYMSRSHGQLRLANGQWLIEDLGSSNGLIYGGETIASKVLEDGDSIRIDYLDKAGERGVLLVFSQSSGAWQDYPVPEQGGITIGRGEDCDIRLPHVSVSRLHARIACGGGRYFITDEGSKNGVFVNGQRVEGKAELNERDFIIITNSKLIFTKQRITYFCFAGGISVDAEAIAKTVDKGRVILSGVDLHIKPGEMVAIVGGSGAGKTTVMNCLSGYSHPSEGSVLVNGMDLYANFEALKSIIGYVPQADIVFDNLTVSDMLRYAARLRLPKDIGKEELEKRIEKVIQTVELSERKDVLIKRLSGGQRKRASIAVELLSDPNLFFLDEPASGLDPGTERHLMETLKRMAGEGKTVIFVTHSTLNLHLCSKVAFMGAGGNLCFFGTLAEALAFFGVSDVVDVYKMLTDEPLVWRGKYDAAQAGRAESAASGGAAQKARKKEWAKQTAILTARHLHIMINDRVRLLLIMLQAPLLALLISFVANGKQFDEYTITKSLLFALSCSAFWLGILNSIQEVCKERVILTREYMTGVRMDSYVVSKMLVMAIVCAAQSLMLTAVFALAVGLPDGGVLMGAYPELLLTTFVTALAASATGIFVSSLFSNADRAMTVAPLLLMPQLLFSGLIFKLKGASEVISYFAACRWSVEGFGVTANLNALPTITDEDVTIPRPPEDFYEFTAAHLLTSWAILCGFVLVFAIIAGLVLRGLNKERG
ncbi:MAG: FHA domain-containing protein [Lachnospiraceae bacterium]|nr:FHA domain-containing protein [Lachnospiraceae bacterium]